MVFPRVLTALLLTPFVIAVVWYGSLPFFFFVVALTVFCLWEYSNMANEGGYPNQFWLSMAGGVLVLLALYLDGAPMGPVRRAPGPLFILGLWVFASFVHEFFRQDKGLSFLRIITTLAGVILFGLMLGHFLLLRDMRLVAGEGYQPVGRRVTFFLIIVIWVVDTSAWFVGRLLGRHSLAPRLSPKKTWEGAIGGTAIACLAGWFMREAFLREALGPLEAVSHAFLIAVTGQVSDLSESLLKRSFGVKDSSQLLPGHGGLMDRFDAFIFAAPFYYYALIATGRFH